ncbi:MAG: PKD domain-containing protein [Bacteroidota bacterium]
MKKQCLSLSATGLNSFRKLIILVFLYLISFELLQAQCTVIITETGNNPFCAYDSLKLRVSPGTVFQWYQNGVPVPGATDSIYYAQTDGIYNCLITDACGTDSAAAGVIAETNNVPVVNVSPSPTAGYCTGDSVQLTGSSGGTSQWYLNSVTIPGANSFIYYASTPGHYNMTKTNLKNCTDSAVVGVDVTENNLPVVTLTPPDSVEYCANESVLLTGSSGGTSQWYLDGVAIPGADSNTYYATAPGIYNMTKIDTNGCTDSAAAGVLVIENNVPVVTLSPPDTAEYCAGDSVLLTGSSGGTSQWYQNGVAIPGAGSNTYYAASPGIYNMTKTNAKGCTDSAAAGVLVIENNLPAVTLTPPDSAEYCANDSVLLTGSSGGTNQWYLDGVAIPGAGSNTYYASVPGIYNMTKTNAKGCADSATAGVLVIENNIPTVTLTPPDSAEYCAGDSVLLTGSSGGASQWYLNGVAIPGAGSNTYYAASPGIYNMTKTNAKGCTDSAAAGVLVIENNVPVVTLTPPDSAGYCAGDSVLLTGSSGGASQWYLNGVAISGANSNTYYAFAPGIYNMIKTDANGCTDSAATGVEVTENNLPVVTLTPSDSAWYCTGDDVLLTGSSVGTSQWYFNGVIVSGATSDTYYASSPGIYNMTNTNTEGCIDSATAGVQVIETITPTASFGQSEDTVDLAVSGNVIFTNNSTNATSWIWYFGTGDSSVVQDISYTYSSVGAYIITLIAFNGECSDNTTSEIEVIESVGISDFSLSSTGVKLFQIYPNPFNKNTTIHLELSCKASVELIVCNLFGQKTRVLINKTLPGGKQAIIWDARNDAGAKVGAGWYNCRLIINDLILNKKFLLIE